MGLMRLLLLLPCCAMLLGSACLFSAPPVLAQEQKESETAATEAQEAPPQEEAPSITRHVLEVGGDTLRYTAKTGEMIVPLRDEDDAGRIFYVAYEVEGGKAKDRPVTFAFNGGPGASSVWLHMGALGPVRVDLGAQGEPMHTPVGYVANPESWLRFSDLVFVDPVGTGYSRSGGKKKDADKPFWGVEQDVKHMASFIRLYMTRNQRWESPVFLVGESYGTTRAAALSLHLLRSEGIALNGLVLLSPVLDFSTLQSGETNLPYALFLPSYAMTARFHGKGGKNAVGASQNDTPRFLYEVEQFVEREYVPALFRGEAIGDDAYANLEKRIAALSGLPEALVRRQRCRIPPHVFFKNLLQEENLLIGRMDGTVTAVDPDPSSPYPLFDPSLEGLLPAFASAFNAYVRKELAYENDLPYEILNPKVERQWDWSSGLDGRQGYVNTADDVREALSINPDMHVWLACGYYDMATPYYASMYTVRQMHLAPRLRNNVRLDVYSGGHMLYTHDKARASFSHDAAAFYQHAAQ